MTTSAYRHWRLSALLALFFAFSGCSSDLAPPDMDMDEPATGPASVRITIFFEGETVADMQAILRDPASGENLDHVMSGQDGVAVLEGITPGMYRILLSVPSIWRSVDNADTFADLDLTPGETVDLEFYFFRG